MDDRYTGDGNDPGAGVWGGEGDDEWVEENEE